MFLEFTLHSLVLCWLSSSKFLLNVELATNGNVLKKFTDIAIFSGFLECFHQITFCIGHLPGPVTTIVPLNLAKVC